MDSDIVDVISRLELIGEEVWSSVIRQIYINFSVSVIILMCNVVVSIYLWNWIQKYKNDNDDVEIGDDKYTTIWIIFFINCLLTFASSVVFIKILINILNPKYAALVKLIYMVK